LLKRESALFVRSDADVSVALVHAAEKPAAG
jgi:hypothetical protein